MRQKAVTNGDQWHMAWTKKKKDKWIGMLIWAFENCVVKFCCDIQLKII